MASAKPMLTVRYTSLPAGQEERPGEGVGQLLGDPGRVVVGGHVLDEDDELVAAEAGHGVARGDDRPEALAERDEQLIADVVAEAVVDHLEPVDVAEEQRRCRRPSARRRESAWSSRSSRSVRLGRPVRPSCRAWCASRASVSARSRAMAIRLQQTSATRRSWAEGSCGAS